MTSKHKRLLYLNKYQVRVLVLALAPPVIIITALAILSSVFFDQLLTAVQSGSTVSLAGFLSEWKLRFLLVLWVLLTVIVIMTYVVSKNLLGAFSRIFRELDEMIAGQRPPAPLTARKHDDLVNELLKRVNQVKGLSEDRPD